MIWVVLLSVWLCFVAGDGFWWWWLWVLIWGGFVVGVMVGCDVVGGLLWDFWIWVFV